LEDIQKFQRFQVCLNLSFISVLSSHSESGLTGRLKAYLTSPVQEPILIHNIHRLRLPQTTCPLDSHPTRIHLSTRSLDLSHAVPKITPQRDIGGPLSARLRSCGTASTCVRTRRRYMIRSES
jgi:hypothetical protein